MTLRKPANCDEVEAKQFTKTIMSKQFEVYNYLDYINTDLSDLHGPRNVVRLMFLPPCPPTTPFYSDPNPYKT